MPHSSPLLFISDLDGTLLQEDATLSDFARDRLQSWIEQGIAFGIATARSVISVKQILEDLPLQLPVICGNGAYMADLSTLERTDVKTLDTSVARQMITIIKRRQLHLCLSTYTEGRERFLLETADNPAINWYLNDRREAGDDRPQFVTDLSQHYDEPFIHLNIMARRGELIGLERELKATFPKQFRTYLFENVGEPGWHWLSIYHPAVSKGNAVLRLAEANGYTAEQVVVFGDGSNDCSMFDMAGQAYAMKVAHKRLKPLASAVIGSNTQDAVIRQIEKMI